MTFYLPVKGIGEEKEREKKNLLFFLYLHVIISQTGKQAGEDGS